LLIPTYLAFIGLEPKWLILDLSNLGYILSIFLFTYLASKADVQYGQRLALILIAEKQKGHSFTAGLAPLSFYSVNFPNNNEKDKSYYQETDNGNYECTIIHCDCPSFLRCFE
jgi:hypothetical protein